MTKQRPQLPETRPAVSRYLKSVVGESAQVRAYYDEGEKHAVAVVEAPGYPDRALATFTTASLHATPNLLDGKDIRVELMVVLERSYEEAGNIVATSAFTVIKDRWLAAPGVVFPDVVSSYIPEATARHLMWTEPFAAEGLSSVAVDGVDEPIHVLQGMPLTDDEVAFLKSHGFDALSDRLEAADAPYFDPTRDSVV
jgi:hypothetical protein